MGECRLDRCEHGVHAVKSAGLPAPVITRIVRIKRMFGVVSFDVETDRGPRQFDVKGRRDNIVAIGRERYLITDVDGARYEIPDATQLDSASYTKIESLI